MISPELDRHIAEVGALFGRRRRPRRERLRAAIGALLHTAIAAGRVVLPLFGWVLACTASVRWGLRLAGVEEPAGAAPVGLACGVFAWVLHLLCEQVQEEED
jgi:hypothetical protein